jgi:hypothetical protein
MAMVPSGDVTTICGVIGNEPNLDLTRTAVKGRHQRRPGCDIFAQLESSRRHRLEHPLHHLPSGIFAVEVVRHLLAVGTALSA